MRPHTTHWLIGAFVLATSWLLSANAASALPTTLCESMASPCPEFERYPAETGSKATLVPGTVLKLKGSIGTIECKQSGMQGETTAKSGEPLPGKMNEFTFGECHLGANMNCTVAAAGGPWPLAFTATGSFNGTMGISGASGPLLLKPACTVFFTCTLKSKATPASTAFNGGSPGHIVASAVPFERESGSCPTEVTWSAEYVLSSPSPAFLSTT